MVFMTYFFFLSQDYDNERNKMEEKASGFIYRGTTLVGTFGLSDKCRSGAMEAIKDLKEAGIRTVMLTGDNHVAAQQVQYQVNIIKKFLIKEPTQPKA